MLISHYNDTTYSFIEVTLTICRISMVDYHNYEIDSNVNLMLIIENFLYKR